MTLSVKLCLIQAKCGLEGDIWRKKKKKKRGWAKRKRQGIAFLKYCTVLEKSLNILRQSRIVISSVALPLF